MGAGGIEPRASWRRAFTALRRPSLPYDGSQNAREWIRTTNLWTLDPATLPLAYTGIVSRGGIEPPHPAFQAGTLPTELPTQRCA